MRTVLSGYIWQQVSDFRDADVLLADLSGETEEVIGDREYDSNQIRQSFAGRNIAACIPPKKNRKSGLPYDWHLYKKTPHACKAQGLATCRNTIRPLRSYLHVCNSHCSILYLLS